ncbi:MAG: hypothetical protein M1546_11810 [Chloroflexi bacterium]|nr:hypothetical protein [Chloroflexota bacterium]
MAMGLRDPDRVALNEPAARQAFLASLNQALRHPNGLAQDAVVITRPWDFELKDVSPPVQLWHGEADRNAPLALARHIARSLPHCSPRYIPNEGHFSMVAHYLGDLLRLLA